MLDDPPVVQWRGRWAIVSSPDQVSVANVGLLREQLFQVGLSLQATEELPGEVAQQRIAQALDRLDVTIHEIRDHAFDSPDGGLLPRA